MCHFCKQFEKNLVYLLLTWRKKECITNLISMKFNETKCWFKKEKKTKLVLVKVFVIAFILFPDYAALHL